MNLLGKLSVPGCPINLVSTRQGPIALAIGTNGCCLDSFSLVYLFSFLFPSLGDGPIWTEILSHRVVKQLTNQPSNQIYLSYNIVSVSQR